MAILVCNVLLMSSSYTMLIPFLPVYLQKELACPASSVNLWSGIVFSATFAVSAVMAPIWGRMADTRGKRLMAMRSSFLLAVSYFLGGLVQTPEQLLAMRMFQGFSAGLWPMDLAIMTLTAPAEKLGLCLGILQGVLTAGGVVGPLIGGVLAEVFGMRMSFFLAAGALFCSFLMFVFFIKEPPASVRAMAEMRQRAKHGQKEKQPNVWGMPLLRDMMLTGTIVQMVILILQPILTNYITMLAGDLPNLIFIAGLVFSLGGFAGAISAPIWGKLGQKRGFFRMLTIAMLLAGLVMIVQGMPDTLVPFAVCQFVGGLFFSGIQPSINAVLAENTPVKIKGRIFGLLFSAQQVGSMLGPILGGVIATFCGMHAVFYVAGTILLLLSAAVFQKYVRHHAAAAS